jgi:hypothetical protein
MKNCVKNGEKPLRAMVVIALSVIDGAEFTRGASTKLWRNL